MIIRQHLKQLYSEQSSKQFSVLYYMYTMKKNLIILLFSLKLHTCLVFYCVFQLLIHLSVYPYNYSLRDQENSISINDSLMKTPDSILTCRVTNYYNDLFINLFFLTI